MESSDEVKQCLVRHSFKSGICCLVSMGKCVTFEQILLIVGGYIGDVTSVLGKFRWDHLLSCSFLASLGMRGVFGGG